MDNPQSIWHFEEMDMMKMMCPTKMMSGMLKAFPHKYYKKGQYVYFSEDDADKIYFILEGRIKIGRLGENGREVTKDILSKGEIFGELILIGEKKRRDTSVAMEDTTVCVMNLKEMKSMMREHSGLSVFLMKIMGSRKLEMEQRLEQLIFKDSRSRIIEFLADYAIKKGERIGYERVVRKFLKHKDIGLMTATSRQSVTTVLNELREKDIITFNRKRLLIRDMDLLKKEAK